MPFWCAAPFCISFRKKRKMMTTSLRPELRDTLLCLIPEDGSAIGNHNLKDQFHQKASLAGFSVSEDDFDSLRESLIEQGGLLKGKGRGARCVGLPASRVPLSPLRLKSDRQRARLPSRVQTRPRQPARMPAIRRQSSPTATRIPAATIPRASGTLIPI